MGAISLDHHDGVVEAAGAVRTGGGLLRGLEGAGAVGGSDREFVRARGGVPAEGPLAPGVDAAVRSELGRLPRAVVDLHLDLADAAMLGPRDAGRDRGS